MTNPLAGGDRGDRGERGSVRVLTALTVEELASLNEDELLERRFNSKNVRVVRKLAPLFAVFAATQALGSLAEREPPIAVLVAASHVLAQVLLYLAFRRLGNGMPRGIGRTAVLAPLSEALGRQLRGAVLLTLAGGYVLLVSASMLARGETSEWSLIVPWFIVALRLRPAERLLLHGFVTVLPWMLALLGVQIERENQAVLPLLIATAVINAIAALIGLFLTRSFRRSSIEDWRDARGQVLDQLRVRQELEAAREIQLAMLPLDCPVVPWLDICSLSLPATEVGGDYYDFFPLGPDRLAVVVGDVAGHGLASGLVLAGLRSCLTLLSDELDRPLEVMRKLHRVVCESSRRRVLVTLAIVVLDRLERRVVVVSAGHPPVLRWRAADGTVTEVVGGSLPLGSPLAGEFASAELPLEPGDLFLLHSDGLYEATSSTGDVFGMPRLIDSFGAHARDTSAQAVRDKLLHEIWTFKGDAPQADDVTFVTLRFVG